MGDGGSDGGRGNRLDENTLWEIWAAEPLKDDTKLIIRWSRTSFFAGTPKSQPNMIDGKDFSLYHRCKDEAWARERFVHATQIFLDVRLMANGRQIEVAISLKDQPAPEEDMLEDDPKLGSPGGC